MNIDPVALVSQSSGVAAGGGGIQAGYGVSFTDMGRFDHAVYTAQTRLEMTPVPEISPALQVVGKPLDQLNLDVSGLVDHARRIKEAGVDAKPSELVMFSVRCQMFQHHCQLLHTAANKSSEGLSQLFRQQS